MDARPPRLGKRGRDDDDDGDDGDEDNHQDAAPSETTARTSKKGVRNTFKQGYKRFKSSFKPKDDKKKQATLNVAADDGSGWVSVPRFSVLVL
jgi:hypothetical protein